MSKTTLYDMLSAVIPGYLLLCGIMAWCYPQILSSYNDIANNAAYPFVYVIAVFALGYIIGLILKFLSSCIFGKLLNCICIIKCAYNKNIKYVSLADESIDLNNDNQIKEDYFSKYYYVLLNYQYSAVPILEAQVAFLRSMALVLLFYLVCPQNIIANVFDLSGNICCFKIFLLTILIIAVILMFCIQKKVTERVLEDYFYVKKSNITGKSTSQNSPLNPNSKE